MMIGFKFLRLHFDTVENKLYSKIGSYMNQKRLYASVKYTIDMKGDIEKQLESGEIKHRKHPGVRKMHPIKLPPFVLDAIYRLISSNHESTFLKRANELSREILWRKLPVEDEEIKDKVHATALELYNLGESVPDIVKKKRILDLKKQLEQEIGCWKFIEYDAHESLCYLAARAAPNYASILRVFTELKTKLPSYTPKTFFDFGSGVGSAMWAAHHLWSDSIKEYFCVDSSPDMNDLSQSVLTIEGTEDMLIKPISYRQFLPASETHKYDLVVSAFSLLELTSIKERLQVIDTLWRKTKDFLVLIEYGNKAGFTTILDARDYILHVENEASAEFALSNPSGAYVLCPCPHDASCPIVKKYRDSCGLFVTYETIFPRQRHVFKKDFISYVVLRKGHRPQDDEQWPRIVRPVLKKSKHAYCRVCCGDAQLHETIVTRARHGKHAYRTLRSSSLGDLLPVKIEPSTQDEILQHFPEEIFKDSHYFESDDEGNKA